MVGEQELKRIAEAVLASAEADQAEVMLYGATVALTRFANSQIHQNVESDDLVVQARVSVDGRSGVAASNDISPDGLAVLAERAVAFARLQPEGGDAVPLPEPQVVPTVDARNPRTVACGPEERAHVVRTICEAATKAGLIAAGAFRIGQSELAVANTRGVWAYHPDATADLNAVVMTEDASGRVERLSLDVAEIDGEALADEAVERCFRAVSPRPIEPGAYDVILEPPAVADMVDFFATLSFGARPYEEKRSFMSGRLGEPVMDASVSIWDDGLALDGIPSPFDPEGVPRQRVDFVEDGVARAVATDSDYAHRSGGASTGHALPAGSTSGPVPGNLFLAPGDASLDEMVAAIERGILVSRFWYTRVVHPLSVVVTGMTRDGTFLIENGRLVAPVRSLRFTQSYLEAMNQVELIGRETQLLPSDNGSWIKMVGGSSALPSLAGSLRVPALKLRGWTFTGVSDAG